MQNNYTYNYISTYYNNDMKVVSVIAEYQVKGGPDLIVLIFILLS